MCPQDGKTKVCQSSWDPQVKNSRSGVSYRLGAGLKGRQCSLPGEKLSSWWFSSRSSSSLFPHKASTYLYFLSFVYNSLSIKFTYYKCTYQWVLENLSSHPLCGDLPAIPVLGGWRHEDQGLQASLFSTHWLGGGQPRLPLLQQTLVLCPFGCQGIRCITIIYFPTHSFRGAAQLGCLLLRLLWAMTDYMFVCKLYCHSISSSLSGRFLEIEPLGFVKCVNILRSVCSAFWSGFFFILCFHCSVCVWGGHGSGPSTSLSTSYCLQLWWPSF